MLKNINATLMNNSLIHPLGLPKGSIRAILALIIVTVACQQMLSGAVPSLLLSETLMIVLTYYFTMRQQLIINPQVTIEPAIESVIVTKSNPLWLPRGSIRTLIIAAFFITVLGVMEQGRLLDSNVLGMLVPFAAYLLGGLLRNNRPANDAPPGWFARMLAHILGLAVIFIGFTLLYLAFNNLLPILPEWISSLLLSAILYYFGAR